MTENLIACPKCDALYTVAEPKPGERATCQRCETVLIAPKARAYVHIVALAFAVAILMIGVVFLPFLRIEARGLSNDSSIFDVALAFAEGWSIPLVVAVFAMIVAVPLIRAVLLIYTLLPLISGRKPYPQATRAFRISEQMRPWSMAEIFVLGAGVALVKLADIAHVIFGPAFWMFAALVLITIFKDGFMDRWTIWASLETR